MASDQLKNSTKIQELCSVLLQSLDETVFFSHLGAELKEIVKAQNISFFKLKEDGLLQEVSKNARPVVDGMVIESQKAIINHVIKTKKGYFSNDTSRDPMFSSSNEVNLTKKELCIPLICDGIIISVILFQSNDSDDFSRDNITNTMELLGIIELPLKNLKMYISVKNLNETLIRKIEKREQELIDEKSEIKISESLKTTDKEIIYKSDKMKKLIKVVNKVAATSANLLITGQPGTGKGLIASKIHCLSERKDFAFAKLDCSSLNSEQIEKELFGEELPNKVKIGLLELSSGGTILLEEISFMNIDLQAKVARFIKDGQFQRLNGTDVLKSDLRVIASTTKDLKALVLDQKFREDLFYSVITVSIDVPSLKDRSEDVEVLADHFLNEGKDISMQKTLSPCVLKTLEGYHWPGNIRELQNVLERAYILSDRMIIEEVSLLEEVIEEETKEADDVISMENFMELTLNELEKGHICRTLQHLGGNKTKTAKTLGITVKTLYNKLHSYGMIETNKELSAR